VIVQRIAMGGFMSYAAEGAPSTVVVLPEKGVTVVTGTNGSGKSSLIEAVSVAMWGRTLRGTVPWHDAPTACGVRVDAAVGQRDLAARFARDVKGKFTLLWGNAATFSSAQVYDTVTKARAALEAVVGPHDVWRRTCVFTQEGANAFTQSTDAERKRLLEQLLGLDRFDAALKACRTDLSAAAKALDGARHAATVHAERLRGEADRRARADAELAAVVPPAHGADACQAKLDALDAVAAKVGADLLDANNRARAIEQKTEQAREDVRHTQRELERVEAGQCPTCARPWDADHVGRARTAHAEAVAAYRPFADASKLDAVRREIDDLEDERAGVSSARSEWVSARATAVAVETQRARLGAVLAEAQADQDAATAKQAQLEREVVALAAHHAEIAVCEGVLSLTGVRSQLLAEALGGVERIANRWLGRIAGWGMRLELKPYADKASGGVRDAISIVVHGAGNGHGYYAASAGQRRRIDVALVLALAEVANAAHGVTQSTLWFDEVFDALDSDGVDAVCGVLEELARTQPVVLITHNEAIAERLPHGCVVQRLHVDGGKIEGVG
jgi:DNA repair exonuclease SbcCD ATPase subunit